MTPQEIKEIKNKLFLTLDVNSSELSRSEYYDLLLEIAIEVTARLIQIRREDRDNDNA
jgi:hypothetical protein